MKKKKAALLLVLAIYIIYLIFLFFFPTKIVNINNEIKITRAIGDFLSNIPYLKPISGFLINKYSLIAVFFFILGVIYGKKKLTPFVFFIVFSVILYVLIIKINAFINFNYGLKKFFPLWFSLFTFFFYALEKKEGVRYISLFFMIFSLFFVLFFENEPLSGIILSYLASLFLGRGVQKLNKLFF